MAQGLRGISALAKTRRLEQSINITPLPDGSAVSEAG